MSFMNWDLNYHYGVEKMDADHDEMVNLIEELNCAMHSGKGKKAIVLLFHELVHVTENHFLAEESMMMASNYPDFEVHRQAHKSLMTDLKKFCEKFDRLQTTITIDHMITLKHWFLDHVPKYDQILSEFLLDQKREPISEIQKAVAVNTIKNRDAWVQSYLNDNGCSGWLIEFNNRCDILELKILGLKSNPAIYSWLYFWDKSGDKFIIAHEADRVALNQLSCTIYSYQNQKNYYECLTACFPRKQELLLVCSSDKGILSGPCGMSNALLMWLEEQNYKVKSAEYLLQHLGDFFPVERLGKVRAVASSIWSSLALAHQSLEKNQFNLEESEGRSGFKAYLRDLLLKENLFVDRESIVIQYGCQTVGCDAVDAYYSVEHHTVSPITIRISHPIVFFNHQSETVYEAVVSFDPFKIGGEAYKMAFNTLLDVREKAIKRINQSIIESTHMAGYEVDIFCQNLLREAGYNEAVKFPMGHFGGRKISPFTAQIDNVSMQDTRLILPGHLLYFAPKLSFETYGITVGGSLYIDNDGIDYLTDEAHCDKICTSFNASICE